VGVVGIIGGLALFASGDDDGAAPSGTQPATFSPSNPDQAAIDALARRSIEVLPRGEWPSLYDDFGPEFHARCPREEFAQGGATNAQELGSSLPLLGYKRLEELNISGDNATALIVGELRGSPEYKVSAAFQRIDGIWKLAPVPETEGCQAFTRLSG
jgi:hypothetical protein